jgi:hypothetical protein
MTMFYRQCKFKKDNAYQTAWIEERGAKVGSLVELKSDNHEKWEVVEVGGRQTAEMVQELASDYKSQRKASDI